MIDHFERLGLPRHFSINPGELEQAYLSRSRQVHPDYHLAGSGAALDDSVEASAALNEAYTTLRDPYTRAEYLLGLEGGPTATEHKQMPPAFLAEMLEAREQVEDARGDSAAVARLDAEFASRYQTLLAGVATAFAEYDRTAVGAPNRAAILPTIRGYLNATKFVRGLIRDLHAD